MNRGTAKNPPQTEDPPVALFGFGEDGVAPEALASFSPDQSEPDITQQTARRGGLGAVFCYSFVEVAGQGGGKRGCARRTCLHWSGVFDVFTVHTHITVTAV